jgi:V-ATPase subunit H
LVRLAGGDDEDVAAVACYDLGEFARHYPNGRAISKRLLARNVVMALIEHDHPELQKQALSCISKMLVSNWRVCIVDHSYCVLENRWSEEAYLTHHCLTFYNGTGRQLA